jgi:enoyl-CoA hydratase/carnithine racemase
MKPDEFTRMRLDVEDGVAAITFNRPESRNAWGGRSAAEYRWALHWCHTRSDVRVVVVSGESDFCVGADSGLLDDIGDNNGSYSVKPVALPDFPDETPQDMRRNHMYPLTVSVPIIAAVTGGCAGAGFLLASYADIRFGDTDARIATAFAGLGLPAEYGLGWLLPRMVGTANAAQLLYSPAPISAARAAELGWLQQVCPSGETVDEAMSYAKSLAAGSAAESLRTMKRQLFIDSALSFGEAYQRSVRDMNAALGSHDFREGVRALRDKRKPRFLDVS